ncbi:2-amino-4-hydroxy-6-hydroxymethyldihydropteridine diphosphokinase [Spongisporangium articulatum]|uniref:Bifunctional folate synthesis protein n=1 Tax=Spongisporangium articulatum TaxID=3362603 RepID=A0ABW8AQK1_9ACTN
MSRFGPHLDATGRPYDQVELIGLRAFGRHGVFEHERADGQEFVVDVVLHLDTRPAAETDDLTRTAHYGELAVAVADAVRKDPVDLIETLAARIADVCLEPGPVRAVDVAVHKPEAPITEAFADVVVAIRRVKPPAPLDVPPAVPTRVVLALGSNLPSRAGDRAATLRAAVQALLAVPGLAVTTVSPWVETAPVGGPEQPDYLNAVVLATTTLAPRALLAAVNAIEESFGRRREIRWGARTLDIDVITFGDLLSDDPELTLPHPRAHERAFVLAPWTLADPEAVLPGPDGPRSVPDLLAVAADRPDVRPGGPL